MRRLFDTVYSRALKMLAQVVMTTIKNNYERIWCKFRLKF